MDVWIYMCEVEPGIIGASVFSPDLRANHPSMTHFANEILQMDKTAKGKGKTKRNGEEEKTAKGKRKAKGKAKGKAKKKAKEKQAANGKEKSTGHSL